ncbi:bifunctional methyltransferase/pyrophosphohydrolase YabN [Paenibacillus gansuensis]|uniref:Nucleoside triphosphate pyrophosphohydrolase n=1 Tax=Paenibacillus gansuensis TaxID=306542 RepID=A0ABW5PB99_9BACL
MTMTTSARITVVGLGTGDPDQLTLGIWRRLQQAERLYLRTERHPMVQLLKENAITYQSFDHVYEAKDSFPEVYEAIAAELLHTAASLKTDIIYAVPGHPMVAESTVQLLRAQSAERGVELTVLGGESFLDEAFNRFGFDPIDGFQLLDAGTLSAGQLRSSMHTLIAQVYDTYTASDVKLSLMEVYPDDYEVVVGHALGVAEEEIIQTIPLHELDRIEGYGNLSLIWVPRSDRADLRNRSFERLHEIVQILRSPEGCPWDREQTHQSIRKNLIEEMYEVLETIDDDDPAAMCEELGDVMLQVMLHSQMEEETGTFTVYDVIQTLNEKLLFRHPHVFGTTEAGNSEEALQNWEAMKAEEKRRKGIKAEQQSVLSGVPRDLPALMKAYKVQKKAAKVGFDWDNINDIYDKIKEELQELQEASGSNDTQHTLEELGDLLFAVVNVARYLDIDPEEALTATNRKFYQRFAYIEEQLRIANKSFDQTDLLEMDRWWNEAKSRT